MRNAGIVRAIAVLSFVAAAVAQNPPAESRVRIGILNLESTGGDASFLSQASELVNGAVGEVGFYDVYDQASLERAFEKLGKKFPRTCRDPRCVIAVGGALALDRMVYGTVDKGTKGYGISLTLLDVVSRQTIESVSLTSDAGVELKVFVKAAVLKLHGQADQELNLKLRTYFGPEVHHEKQMLISTGVCLGAGLVWAIANQGFKSAGGTMPDHPDEELSGIPSRAYNLPLHARPAALAHAYTAASDDAYGVFYNPAGMSWVAGKEAIASYQHRVGTYNIALSYADKGTREIGFGQAFLYDGDRENLYSEATFVTAFSYKFNRTLPFLRPISLGASVKIINTHYGAGEDSLRFSADNQTGSGLGLGFDLGLRTELTERIAYGVVFKDIVSFVRERNATQDYKYAESNPTQLVMGGTFKVGYSTMLFADGRIPLYRDQNWMMAGAIEQDIFRFFKARFGLTRAIQTAYTSPWMITGGFGLVIKTEGLLGKYLLLDGAYEFNQIRPLSNVLNFSLRFGF